MSQPSANSSVAQTALEFAELAPLEQLAYIRRATARLQVLADLVAARLDTPVSEDHELVLERLPNGEYAWLRADLTAKNRGPM